MEYGINEWTKRIGIGVRQTSDWDWTEGIDLICTAKHIRGQKNVFGSSYIEKI